MSRLGGADALRNHRDHKNKEHEAFKVVKYKNAGVYFPIFRCIKCNWGYFSEIAAELDKQLYTSDSRVYSALLKNTRGDACTLSYLALARIGLKGG